MENLHDESNNKKSSAYISPSKADEDDTRVSVAAKHPPVQDQQTACHCGDKKPRTTRRSESLQVNRRNTNTSPSLGPRSQTKSAQQRDDLLSLASHLKWLPRSWYHYHTSKINREEEGNLPVSLSYQTYTQHGGRESWEGEGTLALLPATMER
jgi:hypothetical protein